MKGHLVNKIYKWFLNLIDSQSSLMSYEANGVVQGTIYCCNIVPTENKDMNLMFKFVHVVKLTM